MPEWLVAGPDRLAPYLWTAALLFALGVLACASRRNAVAYLMGVELMLNGAALQFAAYARFRGGEAGPAGQTAALLLVLLAAAGAVVALALLASLWRRTGDADLERARNLRS
jgi:NADH:ubiquinone oxidoreductase subunit K